MNVVEIYEDVKDALDTYFVKHGLATEMEPTAQKRDDTPSCWFVPLKIDAVAPQYDGVGEQAEEGDLGVILVCKVEDWHEARMHLKETIQGFTPEDEIAGIPSAAMEYVGGELRDLHANIIAWTELYKTKTIGGC